MPNLFWCVKYIITKFPDSTFVSIRSRLLLALFIAGLFACQPTTPPPPVATWPGANWQQSTPHAQEMDPGPLKELHREFQAGVHGYIDGMLVIHVVEANTLLSGLGFESGGLEAAHSIHNGLTRLPSTHHFYHGEKVAFGLLSGLFLTDRSRSTIEEVYDFCESVELPTTLSEIGIGDASEADLQAVAEGACAEGETIHNEAGTILPEMVLASLKTADGFGRRRKKLPEDGDQTG